jgi:transcriptional regulator with XRE-family HTH domain
MQSLKNLRAQLGLSQIQFSDLLGISSGLIALAETGKRSLPGNARKIVLQLNQLISTMEPDDSDSIPELDAVSQKLLDKEIRTKTRKLKQVEFELEASLEKLNRVKKIISLGKLAEIESVWLPGSIEKDAWNLLLRKNNKKSSALSIKIILLKISISGLETELKTATEKKL